EHRRAGEAAEDLVLDGAQQLQVDGAVPVDDRLEGHFEAAVIAGEGPGGAIEGSFRDVKGYPVELVGKAIEEDHVFGGRRGVAEAVADVETEGLSLGDAGGRAPVPDIVVGPDAAAPVEHAEGG